MNKFMLALVAAVSMLSVGCKKKTDAAPKYNELADKLCACTTQACIDGIEKDKSTWEGTAKLTEADKTADKAKAALTKYADCKLKANDAVTKAAAPPPPPPAADPAAPPAGDPAAPPTGAPAGDPAAAPTGAAPTGAAPTGAAPTGAAPAGDDMKKEEPKK